MSFLLLAAWFAVYWPCRASTLSSISQRINLSQIRYAASLLFDGLVVVVVVVVVVVFLLIDILCLLKIGWWLSFMCVTCFLLVCGMVL